MAPGSPSNTGGPSRAGTEADAERARLAALGLLLHRLNGGLNNAVMAFELATAPSSTGSVPLGSMLNAGLVGAERASRAANLLDVLIRISAPGKVSSDGYLCDVYDLLHEHAARSGCALTCVPDTNSLAKMPATAEQAARALVAGLAAIAGAGSNRLCVRVVQGEDGPWFDLAVNGETCATGLSSPGQRWPPPPPS